MMVLLVMHRGPFLVGVEMIVRLGTPVIGAEPTVAWFVFSVSFDSRARGKGCWPVWVQPMGFNPNFLLIFAGGLLKCFRHVLELGLWFFGC